MEWLTHSQKKHCELCKTPFRFTKLYNPDMPQHLPATVLLRSAGTQVVRLFLRWCRALLVASVWLLWLPWVMRYTWKGLFWLADGPNGQLLQNAPNGTVARIASAAAQTIEGEAEVGTSNLTFEFLTKSDRPVWLFLRHVFPFYGLLELLFDSQHFFPTIAAHSNSSTLPSQQAEYSSLLSDVAVLKSLTRSYNLNRVIMDVLEGQIVTLSVVVAFILVFLIREWVVQQQPLLNLAAVNAGHPADEHRDAPAIGPAADMPAQEDPETAVEVIEPQGEPHDEPAEDFADNPANLHNSDEATNEEINHDQVHPLRAELNDPETLTNVLHFDSAGDSSSTVEDGREFPDPDFENATLDHSDPQLDAHSGDSPQDEDNVRRMSTSDNTPAFDRAQLLETDHDRHDDTETNVNEQPQELQHEGEGTANNPRIEAAGNGILDNIIDWIWGGTAPLEADVAEGVLNDEHIVHDVAEEAPFVAIANGRPQIGDVADEADAQNERPGVLDEPLIPDDAEVGDEIEDLEGILQLVGLQGPLIGLFQTAVFSGLLISLTITTAVWLPYSWGKVVILVLANPIQLAIKAPIHTASGVINFISDLFLFVSGIFVLWFRHALDIATWPLSLMFPAFSISFMDKPSKFAIDTAWNALDRMIETFVVTPSGQPANYFYFSIISHDALLTLKATFRHALVSVLGAGSSFIAKSTDESFYSTLKNASIRAWLTITFIMQQAYYGAVWLRATGFHVIRSGSLNFAMDFPLTPKNEIADPSLAYWNMSDRLIAILVGYSFFALLGALYLRRGRPLTGSAIGKHIEGLLIDVLQQAGGVLKVILIISIEMLLFPLYCGLLLDVATLPLFQDATLASRVSFTIGSPWTAGFIHWFIGTCYMFHFALFVAMCRNILRSGVLYFIRDPDDPTFHPIRDVLERNVTSQLRKIGFSAMVYGALVILCLGSVVWALAYTSTGILPIHWLDGKPLVAFPLNLLLYSFISPVLVQILLSTGVLRSIYNWWFRKCARGLSLSDFLFGEVFEDERLHGRYVRAPASDQVRIPKGARVFIAIHESERSDGLPVGDTSAHGRNNEHYSRVHLPAWFRVRLGLFVFCLWALTAAMGLAATILPLLFGRYAFSVLVDSESLPNDVYAFAFGVFALSALGYVAFKSRQALHLLATSLRSERFDTATTLAHLGISIRRAASVIYTYFALGVVVPTTFAIVLDLYLLMPLHAYRSTATSATTTVPPHAIRLLHDWTLGLLYLRLARRILIHRAPTSRVARAVTHIWRNGYLRPDAALATRAVVLPTLVAAGAALCLPAALARLLCSLGPAAAAPAREPARVAATRAAYPAVLLAALAVWLATVLLRAAGRWRKSVRDEMYLVGERLHNFGAAAHARRARAVGS